MELCVGPAEVLHDLATVLQEGGVDPRARKVAGSRGAILAVCVSATRGIDLGSSLEEGADRARDHILCLLEMRGENMSGLLHHAMAVRIV